MSCQEILAFVLFFLKRCSQDVILTTLASCQSIYCCHDKTKVQICVFKAQNAWIWNHDFHLMPTACVFKCLKVYLHLIYFLLFKLKFLEEWLTTGVAGEAFALAGGGVVRKQGILLVVAVDGARGNDVVLILVHQGQLSVVTHCRQAGWHYNYSEVQCK